MEINQSKEDSLFYDKETRYAPIPPSEQNLNTVTAKPWFQVSKKSMQLEGLCFDREGNLYFTDVFGGGIWKLIVSEMQLIKIFEDPDKKPAAVKIHKDGRLFVACLGDFHTTGCVFSINPAGEEFEYIISPAMGYMIDDLVFDHTGGFYFTNFKGHSCKPDGGVFYVAGDYKKIVPIMEHMAVPNGIALSPDEEVLWVTEMCNNRLHRIELEKDRVSIQPFGTSVPYHFTGYAGPDSCSIDADGNLYVAMYQQGRVLVFNQNGFPIGQVLIPGRERGHMMHTTHPMIIPGTNQLLVCSNDGAGKEGSWLYAASAFAGEYRSFQFQ